MVYDCQLTLSVSKHDVYIIEIRSTSTKIQEKSSHIKKLRLLLFKKMYTYSFNPIIDGQLILKL